MGERVLAQVSEQAKEKMDDKLNALVWQYVYKTAGKYGKSSDVNASER